MIEQVRADLRAMNGNKAKLMQQYGEQQGKIMQQYGGNRGDIPMSKEHPYYKLQEKIDILGRM